MNSKFMGCISIDYTDSVALFWNPMEHRFFALTKRKCEIELKSLELMGSAAEEIKAALQNFQG